MHSAISNILSVAKYERIMLLRTTKFRILGGLSVLVPVLVGGLLAIAEANGAEIPSVTGLSAYLPFYIYSYLQAVVIAFIAGDFRAADERSHIYEVVAARPLSTAELVMGKYLGVVGALVTLSLAILVLTLAIQAAKISITGTPFTVKPYITYFFLMNLPALIYMSSVTFCLGALLRRQNAVALIVITYVMAVLFFLGRRYGGIYDFGAFFAPLFYSDFIGVGNIERVVDQRIFYLVLSVAFFGLSIERYPRLAQSPSWKWFGHALVVSGLVLAYGLYDRMERQDRESLAYRQRLLKFQEKYANRPILDVVHYDLKIDLSKDGVPLMGRAEVQLKNGNEVGLDTLIMSLNPGLQLEEVRSRSGPIHWDREESVIRLVPENALQGGEEIRLTFVYAGDVDLDGFDLQRRDRRARLRKNSRGGPPMFKGDMTAWILPNSAFLPPRSRWYPVSGVDYGYENERPVSFSTAELSFSFPAGLEVITQGQPLENSTSDDRAFATWRVEKPVPVYSLTMGEYEVYEHKIHGIDFAVYIHPSHNRQVLFFEDARDQVFKSLDQLIDSMESETAMKYPYPRLSVVEVPFQVQWYYEGWEESGSLTQPGVLMVEEDVLMGRRFKRDFERFQARSKGNRDPVQSKRDLLTKAVFEVFFSPESSRSGLYRSPVAQLWSFDKHFSGDHHSVLKRSMPLFMQGNLQFNLRPLIFASGKSRSGFRPPTPPRPPTRTSGVAWDTLFAKMEQRSFSDLDPADDAELYRQVLDVKGPNLFRMMEAVLGDNQFRRVLEDVKDDYQYKDVTFENFERASVGDTSQNDDQRKLQRLVHDWTHSTEVPGYELTRVTAQKVDDGFGMVVYQLLVRIRNGGPGRGFVQIRATTKGDEAIKGIEIEGGQEVEVSMILWDRPFRVIVEPFFARNRRSLVSPVHVPDKVVEGYAQSYVKEIGEEDVSNTELVVDNDDEGFSMPVRRVRRFLRPELEGGNWRERPLLQAFGRYENNFRRKAPGDGAQPAVWKANIPHTGDYDVAYYFIDPQIARKFGIASSFTLNVSHVGKTDTLNMERDQLRSGWNLLGRYHLKEGEEARVELSDMASGHLYADAVRWRFFDPNRPEEDYEMPTWNLGKRGPGPGGPGRPGGFGGGFGGGRDDGGKRRF